MPHIIVEHSIVDIEGLLVALNNTLVKSELFEPSSIKARSIFCQDHLVGGVKADFVHVTVKLLSGRTILQQKQLSEEVLVTLSQIISAEVALSVEIVVLDAQTYTKR